MGCVGEAFEFYPGEDRLLEIQVVKLNKTTGCKEPYDIDATDTIEVELPATPANLIFDKTTAPNPVVLVSGPLGKISLMLVGADTDAIVDGSIIVRINNVGATDLKIAVAAAASRKLKVPGC